MLVKAERIEAGMIVDLERDPFADPHGDNPVFEFELQLVAFRRQETPGCTLIGFDGWDWCGFPPDHRLNVKGIDRESYAQPW